MKRGLFTILSALSLLLFVAVVIMWVRSYRGGDVVQGGGHGRSFWYARSEGGSFVFLRPLFIHPPSRPENFFTRSGFVWFGQGEYLLVAIPHWSVALLAAALPAGWLVVAGRGTRRRSSGACASCGYDLRASPERCPECGTMRGLSRAAAAGEQGNAGER
jgi:hypothetical protein